MRRSTQRGKVGRRKVTASTTTSAPRRARAQRSPSVAGRRQATRALPPPVEQALDEQEHAGRRGRTSATAPAARARAAWSPRPSRGRRGERTRREIGLVGVHEIDGDLRLALRRREGVDADLLRLAEAHHAPRDLRLDAPPARRGHGGRGDPVGDRKQNGLPGGELQARLIAARGMEPAQAVGQDEGKGHAQREIGLEQVEPDEDRLPVLFLERVDQRAAHRLHQGPARRQGPDAQRVLDHHLGQVDVAHHQVVAVPVHDGRPLQPPHHLDGHVARAPR